MQRALVLALMGSVLGAGTCQKNIARPPVEEVPIRDPSETAAPPPLASASAKAPDRPEGRPDPAGPAAPTVTTTAKDDPPEPPRDKAFPRQADACKKDEDCAATNLALGGDLMCCSPCKPVAGTRAWVKRVEQVCQQKTKAGLKTRCASFDCGKPEVECRAGKCAVK